MEHDMGKMTDVTGPNYFAGESFLARRLKLHNPLNNIDIRSGISVPHFAWLELISGCVARRGGGSA